VTRGLKGRSPKVPNWGAHPFWRGREYPRGAEGVIPDEGEEAL